MSLPLTGKPSLLVRVEQPFNAEPPADLLRQSLLTPRELFFVRNHGSIPGVDPTSYRLSVTGRVQKPLELSLDDLRTGFPRHTLLATLQCTGNRRGEMSALAPTAGRVQWAAQAIGNAAWSGVSLGEVLRAAGIEAGARHVAFLGRDEVEEEGENVGFGGSVPRDKALSPEVLLAFEMNGEPLPPAHGFPLRVVVPGYIGARSVKWLSQISAQTAPSSNFFQARYYKLFPPGVRRETVDWTRGLMLGETAVNSAICRPQEGQTLPAGRVLVQGYAVAGGGRLVERVDVSADDGEAWVTADLSADPHPWTWRFWEAQLTLPAGAHQIVARAWDSAAQTQPEYAKKIWNFMRYANNAWHRVNIRVK